MSNQISKKPHTPPRWLDKLLEQFCAPHLLEEVVGDLHERYYLRAKRLGVTKARRQYLWEVIACMRPIIFKRKVSPYSKPNFTEMLRNYFIITVRNLLKQKLYSFINIGGLAVGLACFILILHFVQHELSYDGFHDKGNQIFRAVQHRPTSNGFNYWAATSPALAHTLVEEFPEVSLATTVGETYNPLLSLGDQHFQEYGILADENFFDIFTFPLIQGSPKTALNDKNNIVLTASLANKIFGKEDPMGKVLIYQNDEVFTVTGIMADISEVSHLKFDYILPASSHIWYREGVNREPWYNNGWYTYTLLIDGADVAQLEGKMRTYIDEKLVTQRPETRMQFFFQPLADIHLHSQRYSSFDFEKKGDIKYVYLFAAIGFVILLLACVNYTNLAIVRSIKRAREVGMRKAVGATRRQLVIQFLSESIFMVFLALLLALVIADFLMPTFGNLLERTLEIDYLGNELLLPTLIGLVLVVGLLSGSYPAFFMVLQRPVQALSGKKMGSLNRFQVQRLLIVLQYTVSIVLVVGSLVVHQQMRFMQNRELGYDREQILTVRANDQAISSNYTTIYNKWLSNPQVAKVSYSKHLPTAVGNTQSMFGWEGSSDGELLSTSTTSIDYDFLEVYGIEIVAGRGFSRSYTADTLGAPVAIVNEATVKALGWKPEEALGQQFGYTDGRGFRTIIGVMKDFHFNSIHSALGPLVLTLDRNPTGYISAKVRTENVPETIALFESTVKEFSPYPFAYQFLDDNFSQLYKREIRLGEMFGFFTFLAFLIASLGLFGLAAFTAEQRTKEVGIRKVLGASSSTIVQLLSKDFLKLVFISFLIATPIAWFSMTSWLQNFVYRIDLSWWIFALAGMTALLVALFTVSFQAIKAAIVNPVKSLRSE
ncbi:MAG: ABC transporter permease [Bacteroidota bacterium]